MGRFLLASDDARTRIGIGGALERAGHQVDRVTHLQLAAQHADLSQVGAVVVGLEQPDRRERFIGTLRARRPQVPVVVLLDARAAWQQRRLEALGATVILRRSLPLADLVERLQALAARAAGSRLRQEPLPAPTRPRNSTVAARV